MVSIPHPTPDGSMIVQYFISHDEGYGYPAANGQIWRVIVNAQKEDVTDTIDGETVTYCEPLSYYFAEVELTSSSTYTIRLGISTVTGGVRTEATLKSRVYDYITGSENPPFGNFITARISDWEFCMHLGVQGTDCGTTSFEGDPEGLGAIWLSVEPPGLFEDGYYCGMQVSEADLYIANFSFAQHFKTVVQSPTDRNPCPEVQINPRCDFCFCTCGNEVTGDVEIIPDVLQYRIYPAPGSETCGYLTELGEHECEGELVLDAANARWIQVPEPGETLSRKICCTVESDIPQEFIISFHCPQVFRGDPDGCAKWYLRVSGGGAWPPPTGDKPGVLGGCCVAGGQIQGSSQECIIPDTVCNWERGSENDDCKSWTFCYPSLGCNCPRPLDDDDDDGPVDPDEPEEPVSFCYICVDVYWT
jgi:hypothetical protein